MKLPFEARHVIPSSSGRRVLFADFESSVVILDLIKSKLSQIIKTTFDFGGNRLGLSDELDGIVAGAYHKNGIAFYSGSTGDELWRRKGIKKVQQITLSRDGLTARCGIHDSSLILIDLRSGDTIRRIRAAKSLHYSPYDEIQFLDGAKPQVIDQANRVLFYIDRTTFAFLGVAFSPGFLCLTESGGPLRCFAVDTGQEVWRYEPEPGNHFIKLDFNQEKGCFVGIEWPFGKGGDMRIIQLSHDRGLVLGSIDLPKMSDCCFALSGKVLVTSEMDVIDPITGTRWQAKCDQK